MSNEKHWIVADIETSGLDPKKDIILEVAMVSVDKDLSVTAARNWVVGYAESYVEAKLNDFTRKMHTDNGLLDSVYDDYDVPGACLDPLLVEWLRAQGCTPGSVILAGNSVHFDRSFLVEQLPLTTQFLFHRMIDVSSLNVLHDAWLPPHPKGEVAHRAMADCMHSLARLREYKRSLFEPAAESARVAAAWARRYEL